MKVPIMEEKFLFHKVSSRKGLYSSKFGFILGGEINFYLEQVIICLPLV